MKAILTLSLLLSGALVRHAVCAAELQGVMDQGFLNLSWDAPDAKLEEATALNGPWQTVITPGSPYQVHPSSLPCRFYRLKMPPWGKKWLTVAAVTMTSQTNTGANLQAFFSYMDQAASAGADLVVFPEVALQGCPPWAEYRRLPTEAEMTYVRETAETVPGPSTDRLVAKATELGIHVVFGMTEKDEAGKLYNAAVFLGPAGVIGTHHKSILKYANDNLIWIPGTGFQVFDSPLGKIGLIICAEMGGETGSPETFPGPRLAALGADLLVTASAWWTSIASNYDWVTVDNARMAARWHVIAQQVGRVGYTQCYGHSRIVDPLGRIVGDTGATEGMVIWATDILTDAQIP